MKRGAADLEVFVPRSLGPLLRRPAEAVCARETRGAILFCDVSGFTPMTEALSILGREGAEELTRVLNTYFTRMIGIIDSEGGDVLRFGGDAMTVLFEEPCGDRPYRAALAMMEAMGEFAAIPTRAGTFVLSMKIGAAAGKVLLGLVGDEASARDYYAAGAPLDDAADAEHHAVPGLVVLHPSALEQETAALAVEALADGYARLVGLRGEARTPPPALRPLPAAALRAFVPAYLAERAGGSALGEHRGTAVVFLSLAGFDWSDPGVHARIDGAFRVLSGAARRYGGVLNKMDMGDKGAKGILLFGAPYALERKEEMAARAALECLASPDLPEGLTLKAGVTSAPLFSGPVGAPTRREFTVMGDGINLAARLMGAAAPGQVLASRAVREAAQGLVFEALGPIRVKGKAEPVEIFSPSGERAGEAAGVEELVERETACATLKEHLFGGEVRPLALLGAAGLGKTALARWAYREAKVREIPAAYVPLAPYSAESPFSAWRGVVRQALGLKRGDPPDAARAARDRGLASEEAGFRPALNPLLGLAEEESPALKGLSPKERKDLAFALVERLLQRAGERAILFDGLQWADPLSLELLESLVAAPGERPWRLAVFSRETLPALQHERWERFELAPLSEAGARALLVERHGLYEVPEAVLGWFQQRARGNPATLAALLESLDHAGLLVPGPGGRPRIDEDRLFKTVFPDTLEGLYLQQVDRLPAIARRALQDASALGYSISMNLLRHATGLASGDLEPALAQLRSEGLLRDDSRGERPYLAFAAPLLRDAVYAAIPFAQRREVHASALAFLETEGLGERPAAWPSLAHHAEQAEEPDKARHYHRLAGRDAVQRYDNQTALRHMEFLCRDLTPDPEEIEDALSLMDAYGFLGHREGAGTLLPRLEALDLQLTPPHRARLRFFRAQSCWQGQRWDEAEALLKESLSLYELAGDTAGVGKTLVNLVGGVFGPTGKMDEAKACLDRALALPLGSGQAAFRTMALSNLGIIHWQQGDPQRAESYLKNALAKAHASGLWRHEATAAGNLTPLCYERGEHHKAVRYGERATRLAHALALRDLEQSVLANLVLAWMASGQVLKAHEAAKTILLAESSRADTSFWQGLALEALAHSSFLQCDFRAGFDFAERALGVFAQINEQRHRTFVIFELLRTHVYLGDTTGVKRVESRFGGTSALLKDAATYAAPPGLLELLGASVAEEALDGDALLLRWFLHGGAPPLLDAGRLSHEEQVRLAYAQIRSGLPQKRGCVERLVNRAPAGIWGLRLRANLYQKALAAGHRGRARALRLACLKTLYHCRAHSPDWVWRRIVSFDEISALLRGNPGGSRPRPGPR